MSCAFPRWSSGFALVVVAAGLHGLYVDLDIEAYTLIRCHLRRLHRSNRRLGRRESERYVTDADQKLSSGRPAGLSSCPFDLRFGLKLISELILNGVLTLGPAGGFKQSQLGTAQQ